MSLTAGSTFAGIEGIGLAAERAGMTLSWSCEINDDAQRVIAHHFPHLPIYGDITEIGYNSDAPTQVAPVDVLCGGFPCQDLSVAGRRAGLAGERSGLFFELARVAEEIQPTWIVLENVPGLLSSHGGRDMGTVLSTLADLGYGWAYRVLDARYFGVPQRRRRVVIVGHLGAGTRAGEVLFEPEGSNWHPHPGREKGSAVAALTSNGVGTCGADDNQAQAGHLIPALTTRCGNTQDDQQTAQLIPIGFHQTQDPISTINGTPALGGSHKGATLGVLSDEAAVRRLTPLECERLQGFPDHWTAVLNKRGKPMAESARYRMLGNAVAVPVFEWVMNRLAAVHEAYEPVEAAA